MFEDGEASDRQMGRWSRQLAPLFKLFETVMHGQGDGPFTLKAKGWAVKGVVR
jgi:hypothetical protein